MFGRRRHRDGEVITASEALVDGRYAEHLAGRRCAVPVWAWTNLLAHATDDQLRHAASVRPTGSLRRAGAWCHARTYLAGEVLDAAARRGSLRSVQAEALVPLELDLMARPASEQPTPAQWVTGVLAALSEHRSRHPHT